MAEARGTPYIWASWLARVWAGSTQCHWQYWFRTHYLLRAKQPSTFDAVGWQMKHTRLLTDLRRELIQQGLKPRSEVAYEIRVPSWDAKVAGRIDCLITDGRKVTVFDCKTGVPRPSDQIQVMIAMHALSRYPQYASFWFHGSVVYPDQRLDIPALPTEFAEDLEYFVGLLAGQEPAIREPGADCGFCAITSRDCPERVES